MATSEVARRPRIRRGSPSDSADVVRTMVSGFADDPLYRWLYPDPDSRPGRMDEVFRFIVGAALSREAVWVLDDLSAVAVWTPAGVDLLDGEMVDSYAALLHRQIGPAHAALAVAGMAACAEYEPTGAHSMLHSMVARRDRQGTGAGSALLGHLIEASDAQFPVYLDSSNARNVSFYRRHGFDVIGRTAVPGNGPTMMAMLRPADGRQLGDQTGGERSGSGVVPGT